MPKTVTFGDLEILYPENWIPVGRSEDEGPGVDWELPSGGFFSLEKRDAIENGLDPTLDWIETHRQQLIEDYENIEEETIESDLPAGATAGVEFRFFYLDLLILSRLYWVVRDGQPWTVQIQAESRRFEENERVFAAILRQLAG